jgi:hypothetical protein
LKCAEGRLCAQQRPQPATLATLYACQPLSMQYMLYEQLTRLLKQWKATRLARIQEQQQKEQQGSSESPDSCPSPRPPSAQLAPWEIFLASALSKVGGGGWVCGRVAYSALSLACCHPAAIDQMLQASEMLAGGELRCRDLWLAVGSQTCL